MDYISIRNIVEDLLCYGTNFIVTLPTKKDMVIMSKDIVIYHKSIFDMYEGKDIIVNKINLPGVYDISFKVGKEFSIKIKKDGK